MTLARFSTLCIRRRIFRLRESSVWYRSKADHFATQSGDGDQFWQPKYYSFEIYGRQKLEEKLRYLHLNPERAGLVERALGWRWSSIRWYEWGRSVGVPIRWVDCD